MQQSYFEEPNLYKAVTQNEGDAERRAAAKAKYTTKEQKAVDQNWAAFCRLRDSGHMDWVEEANKFDEYYVGNQWSKADLDKLAEAGRPALTINKILPTVNALVGEQAARRADIQYKPDKNGVHETAAALTKVYLAIDRANQMDWLESEVFLDGIITDRGFYDVRINTTTNIFGDIEIRSLNPRRVMIDKDADSYDPAKWREVIINDWMTLDEVAATYGKEKADQLLASVDCNDSYGYDSVLFTKQRFGSEFSDDSWATTNYGDESTQRYVHKVRVIDRQYARMERVRHFVDPTSGDTKPVPNTWNQQKTTQFAIQMGLGIIWLTSRVIYWTVTADKVLLHDAKSPYRTFTVIPYFPVFRRGKAIGVVRNLISPQDQLNKLESQELHIVNSTANSGWIVQSGTLANMSIDELYQKGAETGLVLEWNGNGTAPVKIQPNQIPTGVDRISLKAANNLKEISSITDAMLGTESPEVSGVATRIRERRGSLQIAGPFENLARTRYLLGRKILELVQQYYTSQRVLRYTDVTDPNNQDQELVINQVNAAGQVINDVTIGEYSIVVSSMPNRDTFASSQFAEAIEMRSAGVAIPDDVIIENSSLVRRHEVAERVRKLMGQGTPTPEEIAEMQWQQQYSRAFAMAQLRELEARIGELEARRELAMSKAASELSEDNRLVEQLEAEIARVREELDLRRELAALDAKTTIRTTEMKNEAALAQKLIDAKVQSQKQASKSS